MATIEPALKEIKKLTPKVKQQLVQAVETVQKVLGKLELTKVTDRIEQSIQKLENKIGNLSPIIEEAFFYIWDYNGNGDTVVSNLENSIDSLVIAINNVAKSKGFQEFLKSCSEKLAEMSENIAEIDWQPIVDSLTGIATTVGTAALDVLNGLTNVFKWLLENPMVIETLMSIAIAIGTLVTAISIYNTITEIMTVVTNAAMLQFLLISAGIIALIAILVLCVLHWEDIKTVILNVTNATIEVLTNLWSQVSFIFEAIWNTVSSVLQFIWDFFALVFDAIWCIVSPIINAIWNLITTVFQSVLTILSTTLTSIWNIFSQIFNWIWQLVSTVFQGIWNIISPIINKVWETIKFVLGKIKEIWSNLWNEIKTTVVNIWNGIWGAIKVVINSILGGIESFVNGIVKGINIVLGGISDVANAVGSLIGIDPISLQLNTISLPRLAKGNVAYNPMLAIFGEYAGASSNPEITTPQNIMRETFDEVLSNHDWNNQAASNGELKQLVIQFGSTKVALEIERLLQQARRQNGLATITI